MITGRFVILRSRRNTASASNTLGGAYERGRAICSRSLSWKDVVIQRRHDMHAGDQCGRIVAPDEAGITSALWCYIAKRYEKSHVKSELQSAPQGVNREVVISRSMRFETGASRRATTRRMCRLLVCYSSGSTVWLPSLPTARAQSRTAASPRPLVTENPAPHLSIAPPP